MQRAGVVQLQCMLGHYSSDLHELSIIITFQDVSYIFSNLFLYSDMQCVNHTYEVPNVPGLQEQEGGLQMTENPAYVSVVI